MQPGKPQGFGVVGEDETPIFTLPGNPVSAYVSFEMFVVPALHKLTGRSRSAARWSRDPADHRASARCGASSSSCARSVELGAAGCGVTPGRWRRART